MISQRYAGKLKGVDPRLIGMMDFLQSEGFNFGISEGLRDRDTQRRYVSEGKSKTMNSKHLTGHAVDIHMLDDQGRAIWDEAAYKPIGAAAKRYAAENNLPFTWGGDWGWDSVHFQLNDGKPFESAPVNTMVAQEPAAEPYNALSAVPPQRRDVSQPDPRARINYLAAMMPRYQNSLRVEDFLV